MTNPENNTSRVPAPIDIGRQHQFIDRVRALLPLMKLVEEEDPEDPEFYGSITAGESYRCYEIDDSELHITEHVSIIEGYRNDEIEVNQVTYEAAHEPRVELRREKQYSVNATLGIASYSETLTPSRAHQEEVTFEEFYAEERTNILADSIAANAILANTMGLTIFDEQRFDEVMALLAQCSPANDITSEIIGE